MQRLDYRPGIQPKAPAEVAPHLCQIEKVIQFLFETPGKNARWQLIEIQISSLRIFISTQGLFSKHLSDQKNLREIKGIVVYSGRVLVYVDCDCRPVFSPLIKLFNFSDWIWNWVSPQPSPLTGLSLVIANTVLLKNSTKQIEDKNLSNLH